MAIFSLAYEVDCTHSVEAINSKAWLAEELPEVVDVEVVSQPSTSQDQVDLLFKEVSSGLAKGIAPELTSEGTGGVYFLKNEEAQICAVFKPSDEETMGPNNPRGFINKEAILGETDSSMRRGFKVGEGASRERAAYLLDVAYGGFSGVPATGIACLPTSLKENVVKEGSVQLFIDSVGSCEEIGSQLYDYKEVQKVGIVDLRLFNTDRHAANILLTSKTPAGYSMVPIDHGYCMPAWQHLDGATFEWLYWPQAKMPFTDEAYELIQSLDIDKDAQILRSLNIREDCITTMRIATMLLKLSAEVCLSLYDIGMIMQREGDGSQPSRLEECVTEAVNVMAEIHPELSPDDQPEQFGDELVATLRDIFELQLLPECRPTKARSRSSYF